MEGLPAEGLPAWSQSEYDEAEEFARAVKVSLLGVSPTGKGSFRPSEDSIGDDWAEWCEKLFAQGIGPIFRDVYHLGSHLKLREVVILDEVLATHLGDLAPDLIEASHPFMEGKENMRGHREWRKYVLKIQAGEAPGHLPVIFALHSVLFRMPLACALQAYAWLEWKMGHRTVNRTRQAGIPEDPPALFLEVKEPIIRILSPEIEENDLSLRVV